MKAMMWKIPITKTELRSFIGFTGFFSQFTQDYTNKMIPLYKRTKIKKTERLILTEAAIRAFNKMKTDIIATTCLNLPNFRERFYIFANALNLGISAMLAQMEKENLKPILFISRKLNSAETNYTVTEKECLAIVWTIKKLSVYLDKEFTIKTDHQALKWLLATKEVSGRIMRWIMFLQQYKYTIKYIKEKENIVADNLIRTVTLNQQNTHKMR